MSPKEITSRRGRLAPGSYGEARGNRPASASAQCLKSCQPAQLEVALERAGEDKRDFLQPASASIVNDMSGAAYQQRSHLAPKVCQHPR